MRILHVLLIGSLCLVLGQGCSRKSDSDKLVAKAKIGDSAGSLDGLSFVKGGPVTIEPGKVYVVEFWATWCPPCRESIPHLTEVAAQYKDKGVVVVGVSVEDEEETVRSFVEKQGDQMNYVVAFDPDKKVRDAYMKAFAERYIPHAFLVDGGGKVVWRGAPSSELNGAIDKVLAAK